MIGVFHLAQDLSFTDDKRVQAAGHQEKMADAVYAGEGIKIFVFKSAAGNAFDCIVQGGHTVFRFLGHQVKLCTVAGRKQDRFGKIIRAFQKAQDVFDPTAGKVKSFSDFYRGGLMVKPQYD